ncbi:MAG: hypothetical protein K2I29_05840, partial [Clostridia bacterium]|nr:hypothetical protein [Clostridia bacterium]
MTNEHNGKGLFAKTESLLGWVSALFGCIFLILNLIVFSCVVPLNRNYKEFAVKFGTEITNFAAVADYELNAAYFEEASIWLVNHILNPDDYVPLNDGLNGFTDAHKAYTDALDSAYKTYSKATAEEKDAALVVLQSAAESAENTFIDKLQSLSVINGDISAAYSSYKAAVAEYNAVLNDKNATAEKKTEARTKFETSLAKKNFEALLEELRDYLIEAKTVTDYFSALTEDKPFVLSDIKDYIGNVATDSAPASGALKSLSEYYGAYTSAVSEYEKFMTSGGVMWSATPLQNTV